MNPRKLYLHAQEFIFMSYPTNQFHLFFLSFSMEPMTSWSATGPQHVYHVFSVGGTRLDSEFSVFLILCQLDFSVVIQGAGGMLMIDPLFQRVLVNECRSRNIPVIFDEVFTGFWRLGAEVGCLHFSFSPPPSEKKNCEFH